MCSSSRSSFLTLSLLSCSTVSAASLPSADEFSAALSFETRVINCREGNTRLLLEPRLEFVLVPCNVSVPRTANIPPLINTNQCLQPVAKVTV